LEGGYLHGDCLTLDGRSLAEALPEYPDADGAVVVPISEPRTQAGGLKILSGNLAPEGAVIKVAGLDRDSFNGKARVFESEEHCLQSVLAGDIEDGDAIVIRNEGPVGGPGMREMVTVTALLYGMGKGETTALITDGRFSGVSRGFCIGYVTPEAALGGLLALVENGDRICIDLNAKTLHLDVDDAVLAERRAAYEPSDRSGKGHMVKAGYAQKYIASVGPASHGAVTHSGNLHWPPEGE